MNAEYMPVRRAGRGGPAHLGARSILISGSCGAPELPAIKKATLECGQENKQTLADTWFSDIHDPSPEERL